MFLAIRSLLPAGQHPTAGYRGCRSKYTTHGAPLNRRFWADLKSQVVKMVRKSM